MCFESFYILASNCKAAAKWQQENTCVTFCDTHKQQMPSFVAFKALEAKQVVLSPCNLHASHGLASKYCKQCKKYLCDKCAFEHASHGATDVEKMQVDVATQLAAKLNQLEQPKVLVNELRTSLKAQQSVFNIIVSYFEILGKFERETCLFWILWQIVCGFGWTESKIDCKAGPSPIWKRFVLHITFIIVVMKFVSLLDDATEWQELHLFSKSLQSCGQAVDITSQCHLLDILSVREAQYL